MVTLVTGATGFIGSHLVARLMDARRDQVRALVRGSAHPRNVDALVAKGLELCEGDLLRPESLDRALDGVSAVYHAAGLVSTRRRDARKVVDANHTATMNLWSACRRRRVARICYVGAPVALAGGTREPVSEDAPFTLVDLDVPYVRAKRKAELATREEIERGLPVVSAYPGYCLGPGDPYFSSLKPVELFLRGLLFAIVDGGMGFVDVRDAAIGLELAMTRGQVGRRYLLSAHNLTWGELFEQLARLSGRKPPRVHVRTGLAASLAGALESVWPDTPLDRGGLMMMGTHFWYDSTRARRELGWTARELESTLRDTLEWMRTSRTPIPRPS